MTPNLKGPAYRLTMLALCLASAFMLYRFVLPNIIYPGWATYVKLTGGGSYCGWDRVVMFHAHLDKFHRILEDAKILAGSFHADPDPDLPLGTIMLPDGPFWVRSSSEGPGVAWLIAEHRWMEEMEGSRMVHTGDVVMDIGAHVGFFVRTALRQGASKVVAVEPDPYSAECLRRNFSDEISSGRVIVVEAGAWSKRDKITLSLGADPGWNSMTQDQGGEEIIVPVLPMDEMAAELGLPRVDFIKMDIEGAEMEALRGARQILSKFRPRVMIDTYQWEHDLEGLLAEVRLGHPDYVPYGGPCEPARQRVGIVPHMTFYEARSL